ncbi:hypothetical protein QTO34_014031 [Cnephaeus nilssonii]|uniref:Embigin n=1 Tax=Cnephaeus nilssonii TaxID=3371016 RepID=A0AA40IAA0_CNENI|nr:hypothetical protein QTO34_014031 [Eptesicus nilssonii]
MGTLTVSAVMDAGQRHGAVAQQPMTGHLGFTLPFTSLPARGEMLARYSNLSLESHNLSLTEYSNVAVEKNITLQTPSNVELTCQFTTSGNLSSVNVTWRKDDELIENHYLINATGKILYTQYMFTIIDSKQMGSYSFFLKQRDEKKAEFLSKLPELHGKNKPVITYVGDSAVLICKCPKCDPLNWTWYSMNGSVQVKCFVKGEDTIILGAHNTLTEKCEIQLARKIRELTGAMQVFQLGESEDHIDLVVLSYLVPLKPFLAIAAEVVLLVAIILLCEMYTQKKKNRPDDGKEFEQIEQLKSDDSNGIENNVPRYRKNTNMQIDRTFAMPMIGQEARGRGRTRGGPGGRLGLWDAELRCQRQRELSVCAMAVLRHRRGLWGSELTSSCTDHQKQGSWVPVRSGTRPFRSLRRAGGF